MSSLSQTPIEWVARWIWHPPLAYMDNFHLLARRTVHLNRPAGPILCQVSCNSLYELWVNGRPVGRGPNPSFPGFLYYDSHDLTPHVVPGPNVIAVRCYNFGPTMQSTLGQNPGPGGLILQLQSEGRTVLCTDDHWRVLQDPARQQRTEPISGHRGGFKEFCDGRKQIVGWADATYDDSHWLPAHDLGPATTPPWGVPIPREMPPLRTTTVSPVNAYFQTAGCSYGGLKYDVTRPEAVLSDDESFAVIDPLASDFAPVLLLDFGRGVYGRFEIDIADGGAGGALVEIAMGESLNLTVIDRYVVRPGPQRYAAVERRGGRYLQLTFRHCTRRIHVRRVVCHEQAYPVEPLGHFACSDSLLNRIWEVGRVTSRSNMQDHFEDAPWREQTLYTGDLAVSALLASYAWGDSLLARKCLRQFARLQDEDGLLPLFGPAPKPTFVLPEYPALWIVALWNHHLHWNDPALLEELWPTVQRCLDWYASRRDERGLFARRPGESWGVFIDNLSNIAAETDLAAEQILYCRGLRCAAAIARSLGKQSESHQLTLQAQALAETIEKVFWDDERSCLIDSRAAGGDQVTQITNGLALLCDIVRPARRPLLAAVLLERIKAPPVRAGNMAYHMVEALAHHGRFREALERVREYWGAMLAHGAEQYWEVFDPESPDGSLPQRLWSLCHAFCAGPVYSLPARFAGIRAVEPGFARVEIKPKIVDLHWISAAVPTPRGIIRVNYQAADGAERSRHLEVSLPGGTRCDVVLETPGRDTWCVAIDGVDLPIEHDGTVLEGRSLPGVPRSFVDASLTGEGVRIRFEASNQPTCLRFTVQQKMGPMGRRIVVAEPAGNWDAAPKPV